MIILGERKDNGGTRQSILLKTSITHLMFNVKSTAQPKLQTYRHVRSGIEICKPNMKNSLLNSRYRQQFAVTHMLLETGSDEGFTGVIDAEQVKAHLLAMYPFHAVSRHDLRQVA